MLVQCDSWLIDASSARKWLMQGGLQPGLITPWAQRGPHRRFALFDDQGRFSADQLWVLVDRLCQDRLPWRVDLDSDTAVLVQRLITDCRHVPQRTLLISERRGHRRIAAQQGIHWQSSLFADCEVASVMCTAEA